jgi:hypothetical protein
MRYRDIEYSVVHRAHTYEMVGLFDGRVFEDRNWPGAEAPGLISNVRFWKLTSRASVWCPGGWGKKNERNTMADQSLDARLMAREQEGRMAASASIGFNAAKPFVEFQT